MWFVKMPRVGERSFLSTSLDAAASVVVGNDYHLDPSCDLKFFDINVGISNGVSPVVTIGFPN